MNLKEKLKQLKAATKDNLPVASKRYYAAKKKLADAEVKINQLTQVNTALEITNTNWSEANSSLITLNRHLEKDLKEVTATKDKYLELYRWQCGLNTSIKEEKEQLAVKYNRRVFYDKILIYLFLLSWIVPILKQNYNDILALTVCISLLVLPLIDEAIPEHTWSKEQKIVSKCILAVGMLCGVLILYLSGLLF